MTYDITVIMPTYNAENFVIEALDSIANQTFKGKVEVLVIDDCSTDSTVQVVEEYINQTNLDIKLLHQEKNMRQGTARNRGVLESKGKYIFFLDSDDFIDVNAFSYLFSKAEKDSCDFVICDWAYYYEDKGLIYVNNEDYMFKELLIGEEVESLLKANTYFSVNKLYKKEFLINNDIKYGEGYIYEDFEFYVQVAQYGKKVGVVNNPFYRVRVNDFSTTKTDTKSLIHIESLEIAVKNTVKKFNPRNEFSYYHLYKYLIRKSLQYLDSRAPRGYKQKTLKKVISALNAKSTTYPVPKRVVPLYHFLFRRKYIHKKRIKSILIIWWLHKNGKLPKYLSLLKKVKWKIFNSKLGQRILTERRQKKISDFYNADLENTVLFLGFDYRYTGNSRYFYDYLKSNKDVNLYFVTKDRRIPRKNRIAPRSMKFYEMLAKSKVVIFESWLPLDFMKREGSTWIQLWHGTPFKKLFFDSHEYHISHYNRNHKKNKQSDIRRWDYLLSDSDGGKEKLRQAFDFEEEKILNHGYPRVQWLKENMNNSDLKTEIKKSLSIPEQNKVILYVPTWRDYNYKNKNPDMSYLINIDALGEFLKDNGYTIIYKEHSMGEQQSYKHNIVVPDDSVDTQELLLVSDLVISDYSSVIFDAITVDIPFYLYINDFEKYSDARGVYEDMHEMLSPFYIDNLETLRSKVKNIDMDYPHKEYNKVKELYGSADKNANDLLGRKILELLEEN